MRCLDLLNTNYENVDNVEVLGEQAFTDTTIMPFVRFVFPRNEHFTIEGPTRSSPAVKEAYEQIDSSIIALKPDITVSKRGHEVIGGEVKKPQHKYFTVFTDLPKLAIELKHMLDHLIGADPSKQATTAGILLEGTRCTTFKMDLLFDGIYRLVEISQFNLMLNNEDFFPAINCYEHIFQLKNIVSTTISNNNQTNWCRPSFLPPYRRI